MLMKYRPTFIIHGRAATASSMVAEILEASDALYRWLSSDRLRLNQDKAQHISRAQLSKIYSDFLRLRFLKVVLHFSSPVPDPGFILDPQPLSI